MKMVCELLSNIGNFFKILLISISLETCPKCGHLQKIRFDEGKKGFVYFCGECLKV